MTARHVPVMTLLAVLLAGHVGTAAAQAESTQQREIEGRAREAQAAERIAALIAAERQRPRLAGIWRVAAPVAALRTEAGELPPLNAAGRKLLRQRQTAAKAGRSEDPLQQCLPPGWPRALWADAPFLLTQAPAKVTLFHQHRHLVRHVFLDGPLQLPADADPTWEGHHSARWEAGTLVIETAGFNGQQWLDAAGLPQSPQMRVTEHWRLQDDGRLAVRVQIVDPVYYQQPWATTVQFLRQPEDTELPEEECSEALLEYPLRDYAPRE
ncbi:MAG: hypothetical protein RL026_1087 [Pseudomonadota bacterium]